MRTANPALNTNTFADFRDGLVDEQRAENANVMTVQGAVNKTGLLLILALGTASFTWATFINAPPETAYAAIMPYLIGGTVVGLIAALVTIFKKTWAGVGAPVYALAKGLALGGISVMFEMMYPGIALQAIGATFGVLAVMLVLYTTRIIKVTQSFIMGVVAATGAIALMYIATFILGMFGVQMPFLHDSGPVGIGISVVIIGVAALNLVLDFHIIEEGANNRAPKWMEWYAAFGLMLTLVWLYLEMLRLISKIRD